MFRKTKRKPLPIDPIRNAKEVEVMQAVSEEPEAPVIPAKVALNPELNNKKLINEINKIIENLKDLEKSHPELKDVIHNHKVILSSDLKKVQRSVSSTVENNQLLQNIINQHNLWRSIVEPPYKYQEDNSPISIPANDTDSLNKYLDDWKSKINNKMPNIAEKRAALDRLSTLQMLITHDKKNDGNFKVGIETLITTFERDMHKNYSMLFYKIKAMEEMHAIQVEAHELLSKWNNTIINYETTTPERKEAIEYYSRNLIDALKTYDTAKIEAACKEFERPEMSKIERKIKQTTYAERALIVKITPKITEMENEIETLKSKNKKVPLHKKHKLNVLKATVSYLENESSKEKFDKALQDNNSYDKAHFSRSGTKNLVHQACKLKGHEIPGSKADKKQKQKVSPTSPTIKPR